MRARLRRPWGGSRASDTLVVLAALAALVSALWGAKVVLPRMDWVRETYGPLEPVLREQEIEHALSFDVAVWRRIRQAVRADDRFTVVSDAPEQHEVRNYAGYSLLPAIQVSDVEDADVVLYYATAPPPGSRCALIGAKVCVERRGA